MFSSFSESRQKQLGIALLVLLSILSIYALSKTVSEFRYAGSAEFLPTITVSGEGEVVAVPDVATFTFSVNEEGSSVDVAQKSVTSQMNKIFASLEDAGVDEKDIKTVNYSVYPNYEYLECFRSPCPSPQLKGYEVSHMVQIKVRNTEKVGEFLALVGGANVDNISGIQFSIDDEKALNAEARSKAIDNAEKEAQKLARDLGVSLRRVVDFQEQNNGYYPAYARAESFDMVKEETFNSSPMIPQGENTITSRVIVTYEIR